MRSFSRVRTSAAAVCERIANPIRSDHLKMQEEVENNETEIHMNGRQHVAREGPLLEAKIPRPGRTSRQVLHMLTEDE